MNEYRDSPTTGRDREWSRRTLLKRVGATSLGIATGAALGRPVVHGAVRQATPAAGPGTEPPAVARFELGDYAVALVSDGQGTFPNPLQILFANAPAAELARALEDHGAPDPWEEWVTPFTPLLIETGRERVLVDTGIGANVGPTAGKLRGNLAAAGVVPEQVDIVVLTHGHPDHIGGLTDGGQLAFPNARHVMARAEWAFWTDPTQVEAHVPPSGFRDLMLAVADANLSPLRDRIELVEDGAEIVPGIRAIAAPGHSVGHLVIDIVSAGQRLLYGADTILHPIHAEHPDWLTVFDIEPEPTTSTRHRVLADVAASGALMTAYHIPFPGLGRVRAEGNAFRWEVVRSMG